MRPRSTLATVLIGGALLATAGCGNMLGSAPVMPAPAGPTAPADLFSDVIGGHSARLKKARARGARPLAPAAVADFVNRQEYELRRETAGTGVEVIRVGDRVLLRLPATFTFDVGRGEIRLQARSTLTEIALTLKRYNQSFVDVLGHTDSTGSAASNQALSQRRAQAVATHLSSHGVHPVRIATRGYGASEAIADNGTESGRALNRRVEIKLVPLR
jgi:outer membrane protein OmpA-like peptidoglycan-associated protein